MIRRMGLIKVGSHVDLDFDHQFIPAHKFDAKYSYKQDFGYFPGWASIGGIIVGGENRDGNTNGSPTREIAKILLVGILCIELVGWNKLVVKV